MAGGGGTRLWPLAPGAPEAVPPLLGDETLLQATVRRLRARAHRRHLVVTDQRYERARADAGPRRAVLVEPAGRNTAAAIALATVAIDRPDDEVMVVLPGRPRRGPRGRLPRHPPDGRGRGWRPATSSALATARHARHPVTHPATQYGYLVPRTSRRGRVDGVPPTPSRRSRRSRSRAGATSSRMRRASPGTPGCSCGGGGRSARSSSGTPASSRLLGPSAPGDMLARAYEPIKPRSIDYAVMEARGRDRRVVMGAMDVGWTDIGTGRCCSRCSARRGIEAGVVEAGRGVEPATATSSIDRDDRGLVRARGGGRYDDPGAAGRAPARGARLVPRRPGAARPVCSSGGRA